VIPLGDGDSVVGPQPPVNKWLLGAIVVAFGCGLALGQSRGLDTESRKTVNSFGAELVLTKKPEEFVREWVTTPEPHRLSIQTSQSSKEVHVGEHIAALVLFWGCRSGVDGCKVSVDFELVAPDGSIRYRVPDRLGATQPRPKTELVYMSQAIVRFQFDPNDSLGQYKVNATVREPMVGNVLHVSQQFLVVK
jgi:hypothetical protein